MPLEKDKDATIVVKDTPDQEKYEFLKEKIRYKQALRENSKKIDHQKVRLNIQADALPSKTFFYYECLGCCHSRLWTAVQLCRSGDWRDVGCHDAGTDFRYRLGFN